MADPDRPGLLTHESRFREVRRVLLRILLLNLAVALAKIVFGQATGSIGILSDGFHSLTDGASTVLLASEEWAAARSLPVLAYLTHS